ncbi:35725_t:CDS:1, partial [Gigaspora margarita]
IDFVIYRALSLLQGGHPIFALGILALEVVSIGFGHLIITLLAA